MKRMSCALFLTFSVPCLAQDAAAPYVVMTDDLAVLKRDFNDAVDQVRLVFIVGPT